MIKVQVHDRFSIEFKVGFVVGRKRRYGDFAMNTWIFVPNSLDINPTTYDKQHFYGDVKSYVRLITPRFALHEMTRRPLEDLRNALEKAHQTPTAENIRDAEYHAKMFGAIFKSALRDRAEHVGRGQEEHYLREVRHVLAGFRELLEGENLAKSTKNPLLWVDEFLSNVVILKTFNILETTPHPALTALIGDEYAHKEVAGYAEARADDPERNRRVVFRQGVLKKYVESDLYLVAQRKKDGRIAEQLLYSIAAGVSMIFATTVAFWGQRRFGSVATPFFFALVVSYMLKDRIKEVLRYYFAHSLSRRYFDSKTRISQKETAIGWMKEAVDFVDDAKVPAAVMNMRNRSALLQAENRMLDEKILLYRKLLHLDREAMSQGNVYRASGVNDIIRLHLRRFVEKADNPETPIPVLDGGTVTTVQGERAYFVNIVLQMVAGGQTKLQRYRVAMTSRGITGIDQE